MSFSSNVLRPSPIVASGAPRIAGSVNDCKLDAQVAVIENGAQTGWSFSQSKRVLDVTVALSVLIIFAVPMIIIAIFVRLCSDGPAVFSQERVGRGGRLFTIYKFRSMTATETTKTGLGLTCDGDQRVTSLGRYLRKMKIDELPQFSNVLLGDMSLVGPRPKSPQYAATSDTAYHPGITGPASLVFRNEEKILSQVDSYNLEAFYNEKIKPLKARIDSGYMRNATLWSDLRIISATFVGSFSPARVPNVFRNWAVYSVNLRAAPGEKGFSAARMPFRQAFAPNPIGSSPLSGRQ